MSDHHDRMIAWLEGGEHPDHDELRAQVRRYAEACTTYSDMVREMAADMRAKATEVLRDVSHDPGATKSYVIVCQVLQRLADIDAATQGEQ